MKFVSFLYLNFFLISNPGFAETKLTKFEVLKKSNKCFKDSQKQICKQLIVEMEQMQLFEFEKTRFRCQSSILGLQTELVEAYYSKKKSKRHSSIMIPYVIKNC